MTENSCLPPADGRRRRQHDDDHRNRGVRSDAGASQEARRGTRRAGRRCVGRSRRGGRRRRGGRPASWPRKCCRTRRPRRRPIYPAAAHAEMAGMVGEMIAEHVTLSAIGARLAALTDGAAAAEQAQRIAGLFTAHAAKENDVLLPRCSPTSPWTWPGCWSRCMAPPGSPRYPPRPPARRRTPRPRWCPAAAGGIGAGPRGDADRACRIAASAWAALREARPDLAAKVTAALHGFARRVGGPPRPEPAVAARRSRPAPGRTTPTSTSVTWPRRGGTRRSSRLPRSGPPRGVRARQRS